MFVSARKSRFEVLMCGHSEVDSRNALGSWKRKPDRKRRRVTSRSLRSRSQKPGEIRRWTRLIDSDVRISPGFCEHERESSTKKDKVQKKPCETDPIL